MTPTARYSHGMVILTHENGQQTTLTVTEAKAVAEVVSPGAGASRAASEHLQRHSQGGYDR